MPDNRKLRKRRQLSSDALLPLHHDDSNSAPSSSSRPQRFNKFQSAHRRKKNASSSSRLKFLVLTVSVTVLTIYGVWNLVSMALFQTSETPRDSLVQQVRRKFFPDKNNGSQKKNNHKNKNNHQDSRNQHNHRDSKLLNEKGKSTTDKQSSKTLSCVGLYSKNDQIIHNAVLNDDYCDCADGRDEPNTSACSHVLVTQAVFDCGDHKNVAVDSLGNNNDKKEDNVAGANSWRRVGHNPVDSNTNQTKSHATTTSSTKILVSRVGDGVVDCPNGRDETVVPSLKAIT